MKNFDNSNSNSNNNNNINHNLGHDLLGKSFIAASKFSRLRLSYGLLAIGVLISSVATAQNFPSWGIIHNSTTVANQTIALGVNPAGNLNTPGGSGTTANNANTLNTSPVGSVGTAYKWGGGKPTSGTGTTYPAGWYDGTAPGRKWEGWGASGVLPVSGKAIAGTASVDAGGVSANITVKSFVVDSTSIKSTVWISDPADTSKAPLLEVTHVYGPTSGTTNPNLFQALVTITNISGGTLTDVRYRRIMDWDILNNLTTVLTDQVGVAASYASAYTPKIYDSCDNGGSWYSITPNPTINCQPAPLPVTTSTHVDFTGLGGRVNNQDTNLGASFTFQFGDLLCNESAIFYIYYGAGASRTEVINALTTVGAGVYSLGYDPLYPTIAYGFGFKGVSGSAVAPSLPTKTASLPAGSSTRSDVWQTYAPPVIGDGTIYQALFKYQKDKQWIGEIKRYQLDANGAISADPPITAQSKLLTRASGSGSYSSGGRSIWTVGYDPLCMSSALPLDSSYNNVTTGANTAKLTSLMYNCPASSSTATTDNLINFVRGFNSSWEENSALTAVRSSVLGDTYHSEMLLVGIPNAPWSSDVATFGKSEAYFRYQYNYSAFIDSNANRRSQLYVGANDGMLHAFDLDLNERWAFIPPSVTPMLRNMTGTTGLNAGSGTSNSIFSMDGPITVKDVYFYGEAKWKTVLMGGLGWGGNSYFALDVTNPDAPAHLFTVNNDTANKVINYWDASGKKSTFAYSSSCTTFDYSKLGGAWSRPVIMLLPYTKGSTSQRWVAVFGGGFAGGASSTGTTAASAYGSYAYVLELEPDASLTTASCGATGSSVVASTGGHVLAATPVASDATSNIPNGVTADLTVITGDGTSLANYYGGIAYFTDLQGKLWKYNLSKTSLSDANSGLFTMYESFLDQATLANDRLAYNQLGSTIVAGTSTGGGSINRLFNFFGSGDQTRLQRRVSTINNRIFGVMDTDFPATNLTKTSQTVSTFTNVNTQQCDVNNSWYADVYAKTGVSAAADFQKVIGRAAVYNKYVYFSAYQPEAASCPLYGTSRLIEMTDSCSAGSGGAVIGQGLATQPVVDSKGNIYVGMSNLAPGSSLPSGRDNLAKLSSSNASSTGRVKYKSWREKRVY